MADANQGSPNGSAWPGLIILVVLLGLAAWGGWAVRGKMDACTDRADYGVLDLGKDAAIATGSGIKYVAVGTWEGMSGLYHKVFDDAPAAKPAAATKAPAKK